MATISASEYNEKLQNPSAFFCDPLLKSGSAVRVTGKRQLYSSSGASAITYKFTDANKKTVAVRCFTIDLKLQAYGDLAERYAAISQFVNEKRHPLFATFEYQREGVYIGQEWIPILKMEWVDGVPLTNYVRDHATDFEVMTRLAHDFRASVRDLKTLGCAHGDLQHNNILVESNGRVRLVDYDGMYVPALNGRRAIEVGEPNYQSPKRTGSEYHDRLDHFSAQTIYLALLALATAPRLLPMSDDNKVEPLLIRKDDLKQPRTSQLFHCLREIGYSRAVDLLIEQAAVENTWDVLDLETFIAQSGIEPINRLAHQPPSLCEGVMISEARLNGANVSTAPAPKSEPITQSPPGSKPVSAPAPAAVGAAFPKLSDVDFGTSTSPKPPVGMPTTSPSVSVPLGNAPTYTPSKPATTASVSKPVTTAYVPPKPAAPSHRSNLLDFDPRDRIFSHLVFALIAAGFFNLLTNSYVFLNEITRVLPNMIAFALTFAVVSYSAQWHRYHGKSKWRSLIVTTVLGVVAWSVITTGMNAALFDIPWGYMFEMDQMIWAVMLAAAWSAPAVIVDGIFPRVIITVIALGLASTRIMMYEPTSTVLAFGALLGVLPWTTEILHGENPVRDHWFNFAETTDRFIARTIALFLVIAPLWGGFLAFIRTYSNYSYRTDTNTYYLYPNGALIIGEIAIPTVIFAVLISLLLGWMLHFRRVTWFRVIGALIVVGIVAGAVAFGWRSVMIDQTSYSSAYGAPEGLLNHEYLERSSISVYEWNLIIPTGLVLMLALVVFVTARTGSTRLGHVFKGGIAVGILFGLLITALPFLPAHLTGDFFYDGVYRDFSNAVELAKWFAYFGGISAVVSLIISIPVWLADYLASDKT